MTKGGLYTSPSCISSVRTRRGEPCVRLVPAAGEDELRPYEGARVEASDVPCEFYDPRLNIRPAAIPMPARRLRATKPRPTYMTVAAGLAARAPVA